MNLKFRCWSMASKTMQTWEEMKQHGDIYRLIDNPSYLLIQFTGLHDHEGEEVYEGDLFIVDGDIYAVVYQPDNCHFILESPLSGDTIYLGFQNKTRYKLTVIGNIHQNKELLEGEQECET